MLVHQRHESCPATNLNFSAVVGCEQRASRNKLPTAHYIRCSTSPRESMQSRDKGVSSYTSSRQRSLRACSTRKPHHKTTHASVDDFLIVLEQTLIPQCGRPQRNDAVCKKTALRTAPEDCCLNEATNKRTHSATVSGCHTRRTIVQTLRSKRAGDQSRRPHWLSTWKCSKA
jgi:hypothetical protein